MNVTFCTALPAYFPNHFIQFVMACGQTSKQHMHAVAGVGVVLVLGWMQMNSFEIYCLKTPGLRCDGCEKVCWRLPRASCSIDQAPGCCRELELSHLVCRHKKCAHGVRV
jgi:hypothetical protein